MESKSNNLGLLNNRYILLEELGSGATSIVYKIKDSMDNKEYALKKFNKINNTFENEIKICKKFALFNNPFFLEYKSSSVGYLIEKDKEELCPYIIFEFCSKGNPIDYLTCTRERLDEKICKIFFVKVLQSVKFLHNHGIGHLDLKLDNLLLDGENYNIKLGDFGFSSFIEKEKNGKIKKIKKKVGTQSYACPEIINDEPYDITKADIFSLGVLLFTLRTGKFGFLEAKENTSTKDIEKILYKYIKEKKYPVYWHLLEENFKVTGLTQEFKDLYVKMVAYNPKERPTIEEIYKSEWLKEIRNLNDKEYKEYEQEMIEEFKKREKIIKMESSKN